MSQSNSQAIPAPGLLIDVECRDLDRDGKGLASWNNWIIVVPNLLPGELAQVQLQQRHRSRWFARQVKLLEAAPNRRKSPCILASDCGGCTLQALDDPGQTRWKQDTLAQTMVRVGGVQIQPNPVLDQAERAFGYRNRALIPLRREGNGPLKAGYYRAKTHRIVNMNQCPVLDPRLDELVRPMKDDLDATGWPADHDLLASGGLRHLGLRLGHHTGEILVTLISSRPKLPGLEELATRWLERWPQIKGVCLNLQPKRNNLVLGPETYVVAGSDSIKERFCGTVLQLSSTTFFQINTPQAERIVTILADWLQEHAPQSQVIDAYCGIGTISLPLAQRGLSVIGLELHQASVDQALISAMQNDLSKSCDFIAGDVVDLLEQKLQTADALVLDPPRKGLDPKVIDIILDQPPGLIAYLSCDVATMARDLKALIQPNGPYELDRLQPVDFFPQTTHLECLGLLRRCH